MQHGSTNENKSWRMITFLVQKQHRKKKYKVAFVAYNELADKIANMAVNQRITINFVPMCNEFNGKWYTNLKAIKIEKYISKKQMKTDSYNAQTEGMNSFKSGGDPQLFTAE